MVYTFLIFLFYAYIKSSLIFDIKHSDHIDNIAQCILILKKSQGLSGSFYFMVIILRTRLSDCDSSAMQHENNENI